MEWKKYNTCSGRLKYDTFSYLSLTYGVLLPYVFANQRCRTLCYSDIVHTVCQNSFCLSPFSVMNITEAYVSRQVSKYECYFFSWLLY